MFRAVNESNEIGVFNEYNVPGFFFINEFNVKRCRVDSLYEDSNEFKIYTTCLANLLYFDEYSAKGL